MASGGEGITVTYEAAADLSGSQYYLVKLNGSGKIALCSALADVALGILQNKPESGENAVVMTQGISKVVAGASVSEGAIGGPDTDGKWQTVAAGTTYGAGQALDDADASDIIRVSLTHPGFDSD